jgi:pyruvate/2-oxoglutarate dehydrogenase complex dihydrolipoamide acyltransferase (E2) component
MTSSEYRLPALPFGRSEATILRWLKQPGEQVAVGDPLVIVVNDCSEVALPASLGGLLTQHLLAEGAVVAADAPLAVFVPSAPALLDANRRSTEPPHRITPVARRIAVAGGLDPLGLSGTGASGRVTKADVLATLAPPRDTAADLNPEAPPVLHTTPDMRAPTQIESGSETSVLTAIEVDLERVAATRARLHADFLRRGLALTDTVCVMAAVAATLPRHPLLNSSWYADAVLIRRRINLALVAGARRVLVYDAQDLNMRGLARALQRPPEIPIEHSTFTIVEYAGPAWWAMPALAARHSATLGIGAALARPAVVSHNGIDRIAVRRRLLLSLAYDGRVLDQCQADAFLHDLKVQLEQFSG